MKSEYNNTLINVGSQDKPYYLDKPTEYVSLFTKIIQLVFIIAVVAVYSYFRRNDFFSSNSFVFDLVAITFLCSCIGFIVYHIISNSFYLKLIVFINLELMLLVSGILFVITIMPLKYMIGFINLNVAVLILIVIIILLFSTSKLYIRFISERYNSLFSKKWEKIGTIMYFATMVCISFLKALKYYNAEMTIILIYFSFYTLICLYHSVNSYLIFKAVSKKVGKNN
jgi:hypothetical protein